MSKSKTTTITTKQVTHRLWMGLGLTAIAVAMAATWIQQSQDTRTASASAEAAGATASFLVQGADLDRLETPLRRVAWFEQSAHFPFLEEPERFHEEFLALHRAVSEFQAAGED